MSINTGVPVTDLPPPVTTGTTTQVFTDLWGEVWVAKNGVESGIWNKARDVIHAVVYRAAAYTMPTALTTAPYDTVYRDIYGMWVGSPSYNYVLPVPGWYWIQSTFNGNASAIGQYIQGNVLQNGTSVTSDNNVTSIASGGLSWRSWGEIFCSAGDTIRAAVYQPAGLAAQVGLVNSRFEISYIGTG